MSLKEGEFVSTNFLDPRKVQLTYKIPLSEIIVDFYDKIKSSTQGYGSLDYELIGYRKSNIEKLEILINSVPCDALSMIAHKDKIRAKGIELVKKLKDTIPKHMFKIALQAAVGGSVIARENISALKKHVTGKCYGGDITRKRKLWEKQKEGKKKMRRIGNVDVPKEAFFIGDEGIMKIKFKLEKKHWDYLWLEWVKPILIAAILALFIRTFIVQPFKIPTNSMYSTLKPGDRIFVNKFIYGARIPFTDIRLPKLRDPEPGDIVVFLSPIEKKKFLVKRFISGGGHSVQIKDGRIFLDAQSLDKSPFNKFYYYNHGEYGSEDILVNVPEGYFYALGDNSKNSMDSRYWGFVPDKNLVGRAFVIHWPVKRIRILKSGK